MVKIVWTEQACDDFEAIVSYIKHDSVKYAVCLQKKLSHQSSGLNLCRNPDELSLKLTK